MSHSLMSIPPDMSLEAKNWVIIEKCMITYRLEHELPFTAAGSSL